MERRKRFNFLFNSDKTIGYGVGYYVFFETYDNDIAFESYYPIEEKDAYTDVVCVGILNKFEHMYQLGWRMDMGLAVNLKELVGVNQEAE